MWRTILRALEWDCRPFDNLYNLEHATRGISGTLPPVIFSFSQAFTRAVLCRMWPCRYESAFTIDKLWRMGMDTRTFDPIRSTHCLPLIPCTLSIPEFVSVLQHYSLRQEGVWHFLHRIYILEWCSWESQHLLNVPIDKTLSLVFADLYPYVWSHRRYIRKMFNGD